MPGLDEVDGCSQVGSNLTPAGIGHRRTYDVVARRVSGMTWTIDTRGHGYFLLSAIPVKHITGTVDSYYL